ncbi:MAG TPA: Ku protein [Lacunisphaera sp.]|nr:Ku protein [Lacunisphaera sp.]
MAFVIRLLANGGGIADDICRELPGRRVALSHYSPFIMRAIWKGSISFGLVTIPVALVNASRQEELKFRLLRSKDLSPVNYKRVAEVDGKEVPWDQIVKGYEYEKGKFVVLKDEDFKRVDLEATDTIDIVDFVDLEQINPVYFYRPYYLEAQKGGAPAYKLLRDVLARTNKVGIAKVIIRTRQHLAAVKANGDLLVLDLMRFEDELVSPGEVAKAEGKQLREKELKMATTLVEQMSEDWDPSRYTDDYRSALMKLIDAKIKSGGKEVPSKHKARPATNVIDLAAVLEESLAGGKAPRANAKAKSRKGRGRTRKAA